MSHADCIEESCWEISSNQHFDAIWVTTVQRAPTAILYRDRFLLRLFALDVITAGAFGVI